MADLLWDKEILMLVISSFEVTESGRRTQPWGKTEGHEYKEGKYYNFRENQELIETSLEDFNPFSSEKAVQTFYSMLRWINSDSSVLESTDCLLAGAPAQDYMAEMFRCTHLSKGRFEFFIRNVELNTDKETFIWVFDRLSLYLQVERPEFRKGTFRISPLITDYLTGGDKITGHRFCLDFNACGNGVEDTWVSLNIMFEGLMKTLERLNSEMISGDAVPL
ncbi:hypothetical protein ACUH7A_004031 [Yersinia enterocolitica]|uniref:hypothetical protein n=2 Tax=Yersinia pseudotuberculosis TaxID=633 RepID=UPI0015E7C9D7|nr:hypothetical protein [Yersinia pseudotuberculosis]